MKVEDIVYKPNYFLFKHYGLWINSNEIDINLFQELSTTCFQSGVDISLVDLQYWDCEKQIAFANVKEAISYVKNVKLKKDDENEKSA